MANGNRRGWRWLLSVGLALMCLACQPTLYPSRPGPPPPPPPAPEPPPQRPIFFVDVGRLNLRAGPGMDFPKITTLERNEEVEKLGEMEDWSQVRVKRDGTLGWVSSRYLSTKPSTAAPEVAPAPPVAPVPAPEAPATAKPPLPERPKPARPETVTPRAPKPAEAAEPPARKPPVEPAPAAEPAPAPAKPAPPKEEPAAPEPPGEKPSRIRIM